MSRAPRPAKWRASALYARNVYAFLETLIDKEKKELAIKRDDDLVKATLLTAGGEVVHPAFSGEGKTA